MLTRPHVASGLGDDPTPRVGFVQASSWMVSCVEHHPGACRGQRCTQVAGSLWPVTIHSM
jgi:hypothetical protein